MLLTPVLFGSQLVRLIQTLVHQYNKTLKIVHFLETCFTSAGYSGSKVSDRNHNPNIEQQKVKGCSSQKQGTLQ